MTPRDATLQTPSPHRLLTPQNAQDRRAMAEGVDVSRRVLRAILSVLGGNMRGWGRAIAYLACNLRVEPFLRTLRTRVRFDRNATLVGCSEERIVFSAKNHGVVCAKNHVKWIQSTPVSKQPQNAPKA